MLFLRVTEWKEGSSSIRIRPSVACLNPATNCVDTQLIFALSLESGNFNGATDWLTVCLLISHHRRNGIANSHARRAFTKCPLCFGLGWLWFGCSSILPSCTATTLPNTQQPRQNWAEWNTKIASQPNPRPRADGKPCTHPMRSCSMEIYVWIEILMQKWSYVMGRVLSGSVTSRKL